VTKEANPERKAKAKPDAKPEAGTEAKTEAKTETKTNAKTANSVSFVIPGASQRSKHSVRGAKNVTSMNRKVPNWSKRLISQSYLTQ